MCKKAFTLILLFLTVFVNIFSSSHIVLTESAKVSLLTCSPSDDAIYALFGHAGLRIEDDSLMLDAVFDYGIFDFSSDNFILRFVKGETDYIVAGRRSDNFISEYNYRGVGVTEQVLNLSLVEKQRILDALIENALPENRVYRYNFFYDNCATRPRDIISQNLDGRIDFTTYSRTQTYRDLLEECLLLTSWSRFGIYLVIGSGADKVIDERQKDFLPSYVYKAFNNANIIDSSGNIRPLVSTSEDLLLARDSALDLQESKLDLKKGPNEPLYIGILLFAAVLLVSYLQIKQQKLIQAKIFDSILFLVAGLAGCVIFFLMFFSEHPCVDANWNLVWLNPLPLLFIPFFFVKSLTKYVISYHFVNFVVLSLFILGFAFIPQRFEIAFVPYIFALCMRSGINVLTYKQTK